MAQAVIPLLEPHFVFLFLFFKVGALDHHLLAIFITKSAIYLLLRLGPTYLIYTLRA